MLDFKLFYWGRGDKPPQKTKLSRIFYISKKKIYTLEDTSPPIRTPLCDINPRSDVKLTDYLNVYILSSWLFAPSNRLNFHLSNSTPPTFPPLHKFPSTPLKNFSQKFFIFVEVFVLFKYHNFNSKVFPYISIVGKLVS